MLFNAPEYAVQCANENMLFNAANALQQPVIVCFGWMADYPGSNLHHYTFMLEGLQDEAASM